MVLKEELLIRWSANVCCVNVEVNVRINVFILIFVSAFFDYLISEFSILVSLPLTVGLE